MITSSPGWRSISRAASSRACVHDGAISALRQPRRSSNQAWQRRPNGPSPDIFPLSMAARTCWFSRPMRGGRLNGIMPRAPTIHPWMSADAEPGSPSHIRTSCQPQALSLVAARPDVLQPVHVLEVPPDRADDARFEGFLRSPAQLGGHATGIDRITQIVPGPVGDEGDQALVCPRWIRADAIQGPADQLDDVQVAPFIVAADTIGATRMPVTKHPGNGTRMVFHIEPFTDVRSPPVDRQRFARQRIHDHQRDELLGKLVGTVVVRAVGD